ncbi:AAA family ATPase [Streptomyces sp. NPDC057686]|uniref:AAA family ATPase n=1 Tax=Streptomyces TaxID=1883 RepID=UPI0036CB6751
MCAGGLTVVIRTEGFDLTEGDGRFLEAEIAAPRPDIVIIGPMYKLTAGDAIEEGPARLASNWLDKLRARYDCAVLMEAHSPNESNGRKRVTRPYGAAVAAVARVRRTCRRRGRGIPLAAAPG